MPTLQGARRAMVLPVSIAAIVCLLVIVPGVDAASPKLGQRTLEQGMQGTDVKELQGYLTDAGHTTEVDGIFGSRTKRGVRQFERANERDVDGVVSTADARALKGAASGGGLLAGDLEQLERDAASVGETPGDTAKLTADGLAMAPSSAPPAVKSVIEAANKIAVTPYRYGGGHAGWSDSAYDCSGSVSFALRGARLVTTPLDSSRFMRWGDGGPGEWITVYAHGGHAYMVVAGLRFDTSGRKLRGTRWQAAKRSGAGYTVRHPAGL